VRTVGKTKIIVGGPHAYLKPKQCVEMADFVCTGEGEFTLLEICNQFRERGGWQNLDHSKIPNLMYIKDSEICKSTIQDLWFSRNQIDELPFPAYGDEEIYVYNGFDWKNDVAVHMDSYSTLASRGCPYKCSYCINGIFKNRRVTLRSPERVVQELQLVRRIFKKLKKIQFVDEVFAWDRNWVLNFAGQYKAFIDLPFECDSFPGKHSAEIIKMLSTAGLVKVNVGVQSCSERVLKEVFNRPQKVKKILEDNANYVSMGVLPTYDFIVDNPFEDARDLRDTVDVVRKFKRPHFFRLYSLYFFPYHPLTKRAELEMGFDVQKESNGYYHKITTNHQGDQYCKKPWYKFPYTTIYWNGDKKAPLNWFLTCYGDPAIPKRIVDYAYKKYLTNRIIWIVILSYYYKLLDQIYKVIVFHQFIKQYGIIQTLIKIVNRLKGKGGGEVDRCFWPERLPSPWSSDHPSIFVTITALVYTRYRKTG